MGRRAPACPDHELIDRGASSGRLYPLLTSGSTKSTREYAEEGERDREHDGAEDDGDDLSQEEKGQGQTDGKEQGQGHRSAHVITPSIVGLRS